MSNRSSPVSDFSMASRAAILVVEDQEPDRAHHSRIVASVAPDASLVMARNTAEALDAIGRQDFAVALVDLSLDGDWRGGEQVVRALQERGETAIVVISGLDVDTFRPMMFRNDVWDYFEKPIDEGSLQMVVSRVLAKRSRNAGSPSANTVVPGLEWEYASLQHPRWRGTLVHLSLGEQRLLLALIRSPNELVTREVLYDTFERWDRDPQRLRTSLASAMHQIRKAFRAVDERFDAIEAVGSAGYLWRVR